MRSALVGVLAGAVLAGGLSWPVSHAQPAPDVTRAKDLYASAEAAMKDGRYADAIRDYGAAYELSKQPALFFKIGKANEAAGKCDVAVVYYARYLREGKPSEEFVKATRERIAACGGEPRPAEGSAAATPPPPPPPKEPTPPPREPAGSASGSDSAPAPADRDTVGHSVLGGGTGSGSGSATPIAMPGPAHKAAWLLVGTSIGLATIGGVLAYAASSSENDVKDLYVSALGQPPQFDAATKKRYDDLIDQGHTYEKLSWISFGLAGATAIGAAVLFAVGHDDAAPEHARITPVISPRSAGVVVRF